MDETVRLLTGNSVDFKAKDLGNNTYALTTNPNRNDLGVDAWGRNKSVRDFSILHGLWTFDVPNEIWKTAHNGVEYADNSLNVHIYSENGALIVSSGDITNDSCVISSKRHPRYQPNRGHLYSTSVIFPNPSIGEKDFGIFTNENGVFFRQKNSKLYAVIRSLGIETHEAEINIGDIDLSKGNTYDIQFQWRGVGSYFFYINQILVFSYEFLGTLTDLSISNPALPIRYKATNTNGQALIKAGCVDITSEGGSDEKQQFLPIVGNLFSATNCVVIAIRIANTFNGKYNTRDSQLTQLKFDVSKKANMRIYITRDTTALTINSGDWEDANGGGIEVFKPTASSDSTFDDTKAKIVDVIPCIADIQNVATNPNPRKIDFFLTNGDYLIIEAEGSAVDTLAIIDVGEEI